MSRPNIVQITCHDLGRHIGCYGVPTVHTPTLDKLAVNGVRFANSFCTSPGCSPSRAALATGRYPHQTGVLGLAHAHFGWELTPLECPIGVLLRHAGYHTVLLGLQHVTFHPERLGFEAAYEERYADQVVENLARFLRATSAERPFYAEINFFEPHRPFDWGGVGPDREHGVTVPPYLPDTAGTRDEFGALQGAIRKVDEAVAQIVAEIAARGVADNTLLLFTADHGLAFPRAKGTLYDPGIETALIVRWPAGNLAVGSVPRALVSNVDVVPTLLEAAGVPPPANLEGRSFLSLMRGERYIAREAVFAEKTFHNEYDPMRCIRTSDYKLILHLEVANAVEAPADVMRGSAYKDVVVDLLHGEGSMVELYDLRSDPLERRNVAAEPAHQQTLGALGRGLRAWMHKTEDPLLKGPVASPFYYRALHQLSEF